MATNLLGGVSNMGWDRRKPKKRTYKSSDYEYRPRTFGSSFSFEEDIQELQYKIDQLSHSAAESRSLSIYGPPVYGPEDFYSGVKEQIKQLELASKKEASMLQSAQKDQVAFARLLPDKYVEYLMDDKLNMAINTKDIFEDTNKAIENMKLGPLPSDTTDRKVVYIDVSKASSKDIPAIMEMARDLMDTPEEQLRIENAKLKAELSSTERQLAVLVKPPTWRTLLKEWFMYKVLKRPKPQPLYIGPYR